jgi:hypothetical protein
LDRSARALAAAAAIGEAVELGIGPHRELSAIFLGVGLVIGYAVGRNLAKQLREWAAAAPQLSADEQRRLREPNASPLSIVALVVVAVVAIAVPLVAHIPTPLPGALAAGAIQVVLQSRVLRAIETERRGEIFRPVGRLSFDGGELRLRAH